MAATRMTFSDLMKQPLYITLFLLGCLGPFFATLIVYILNQEKLGGLKGLWNEIKTIKNPSTAFLILLFLALHYGLAIVLSAVGLFGNVADFLKFIPIMLFLFGTQEIGWRRIIQPVFEESRGFWRSVIITGLFWAIWFLPLIFIPQFVVRPDFFLQFAVYLVGIGMLQTTIYKQSKSILFCIVFSALFFALTTLISLKQSNMILAVTAVDLVIAVSYNSKFLVKQ